MLFENYIRKRSSEDYTRKLANAARGYADISQIGLAKDQQIMKVVINPSGSKTIVFLAGIHGNESAPSMGIIDFLQANPYIPKNKKIIIFPLVNPTGFEKGTRKNDDGEDINRQFLKKNLNGEAEVIISSLEGEDIDLFCSLHEDPSLSSFYLYYTKNKKLAEQIRELAKKYFKIYDKEERKPLKGETKSAKLINGLVPPPHVKRGTIEDWMEKNEIPSLTIETPGKVPFSKKTKFTKELINFIIAQLPNPF